MELDALRGEYYSALSVIYGQSWRQPATGCRHIRFDSLRKYLWIYVEQKAPEFIHIAWNFELKYWMASVPPVLDVERLNLTE